MTLLKAYLNSPRARKALSKKPGQEGFSLIELVVVVAVLAILSAIAIPSFTSINNKARASAAANTIATIAKECAVKYANGETAPTRPQVTPDGYSTVVVTKPDGAKDADTKTSCTSTGEIKTTSSNTAIADFSYNVLTGEKKCSASLIGCTSDGTW